MKLPHDEITDDEFAARWNYHTMKLPKINLQHGEITGDYITARWDYSTIKLPTIVFPAMKLPRWFYGLPLDEITDDTITGG